jgi:hypothetical protein
VDKGNFIKFQIQRDPLGEDLSIASYKQHVDSPLSHRRVLVIECEALSFNKTAPSLEKIHETWLHRKERRKELYRRYVKKYGTKPIVSRGSKTKPAHFYKGTRRNSKKAKGSRSKTSRIRRQMRREQRDLKQGSADNNDAPVLVG